MKPPNDCKSNYLTSGMVSLLAVGMVAGIVVSRLAIGVPNFQPVLATGLFAGYLFGRWAPATLLMIIGLIVSDVLIGFYTASLMAAVYVASILPVLMGCRLFRRCHSRLQVAGFAGVAAVGCSLLFYGLTNGAVWWLSGWYPPTFQGLCQCLVAGLPFLINSVVSTVVYSGLLFGGWFAAAALNCGTAARAGRLPGRVRAAATVPSRG